MLLTYYNDYSYRITRCGIRCFDNDVTSRLKYTLISDNSHKTTVDLVIVTAGNDFFTRRTQNERVLELSSVTALDVDQRRVRFHGAFLAEILQRHLVLGATDAVQPAFTKSQSTEMLIDSVKKRFAALQSQWHETGVETLHVM